jgi:hypothetical protein
MSANSETLRPEVKRFSSEAREALQQQGYVIYELKGESIQSLKDAGRPIKQTWENHLPHHTYKHSFSYPEFDEMQSMRSEVAVNPEKPFLRWSGFRRFKGQEASVRRFSKRLNKRVPGAEAKMGEAPDYIELAFQHQDKTGKQLYTEPHPVTKSFYKGADTPQVATISFHPEGSIWVQSWITEMSHHGIGAMPLIVPAEIRPQKKDGATAQYKTPGLQSFANIFRRQAR